MMSSSEPTAYYTIGSVHLPVGPDNRPTAHVSKNCRMGPDKRRVLPKRDLIPLTLTCPVCHAQPKMHFYNLGYVGRGRDATLEVIRHLDRTCPVDGPVMRSGPTVESAGYDPVPCPVCCADGIMKSNQNLG